MPPLRRLPAVLLVFVAGAAAAADYSAGLRAYRNRDYAAAAEHFRELAEAGCAPAQVNLGTMYTDGDGLGRNASEAVKWFRRAAAHGDERACFNLGAMYARGEGVPLDYGEAAHWFRSAAERGHSRAQLNLGILYTKGLGVPQDLVHAYKWLLLAERGGNPLADAALSALAGKMTSVQVEAATALGNGWRPAGPPAESAVERPLATPSVSVALGRAARVAAPGQPPAPAAQPAPTNGRSAGEHHRRARTLLDRRKFPEAIDAFTAAIGADPKLALAYNGRGFAYLSMRDYPHAIADFEQALRLRPDYENARHNLAVARKRKGQRGR